MAALPQGDFGTTVFKKKGVGWPAGSDAKNALAHMKGKKVGTICNLQGIHPNINLWVAAMADSKHTFIMANTWSNTLPKVKRTRHVDRELEQIDLCIGTILAVTQWMTIIRNARLAFLWGSIYYSLWDLCLFGFIIVWLRWTICLQ